MALQSTAKARFAMVGSVCPVPFNQPHRWLWADQPPKPTRQRVNCFIKRSVSRAHIVGPGTACTLQDSAVNAPLYTVCSNSSTYIPNLTSY